MSVLVLKVLLFGPKEKPNGSGFGYQATFSDVFWKCKKCEEKYNFMSGSAYLKKKNHKRKVVIISNH